MKVLRSILWMLIFYATFASLELSWHWYMSTALPGAKTTRAIYGWQARQSMRVGHTPFVPGATDVFLPELAMGLAAGFASRRVHWAFGLAYAMAATAGILALLPIYEHLTQSNYWQLQLRNLQGYFFFLILVTAFALGGRANIRNGLRKKGKLDGCQPRRSADHAGGEDGAN